MNTQIVEEKITIPLQTSKEIDFSQEKVLVTKDMGTFYNPIMKIHRDISLLVLKHFFSNFKRPISFCDPMVASGIREARYMQQIPQLFSKIYVGDISPQALENCKQTFDENSLSQEKIIYFNCKAQELLYKSNFDCIEIDPFGSPAPFLDAAISQTNHNGLLCVTATDTASLCGVYPKKALRRYNLHIHKTLCFDELGLRGLIAYCQRIAGKFDKTLHVEISFVYGHFYRIFFRVEESAQQSLNSIKEHKYISYKRESQEIQIHNFNEKERIGPLYLGSLNNKELIKKCIEDISIIQDSKKALKLLESLLHEVESIGYYDIHKLQSYCNIAEGIKFTTLFEFLNKDSITSSLSHCNKRGLKTTLNFDELVKLIGELKNKNNI
ncbi:MAG: hypothetical protein LAT82_04235 [Nanoarchaeota archaeon]|nr:hypothetical protein [Nanoarchaeota archaeon]